MIDQLKLRILEKGKKGEKESALHFLRLKKKVDSFSEGLVLKKYKLEE